jgi:hypothetical protein
MLQVSLIFDSARRWIFDTFKSESERLPEHLVGAYDHGCLCVLCTVLHLQH